MLRSICGLSLVLLLFALPRPAAGADPAVRVWEAPLTIPTDEIGLPDKSPVFADHRSYQGAESAIYPYPMWDALSDRRVAKTYKAVYLENRYVQLCVLPEIGGRVFAARDKTNGYDFLYRQHVIKPALIGMVGAWISGGIEWNIPHHHRASTFMPVDYAFTQNPDGSAAIQVGELELRHRMRWVVELRLRPDSSCVEQTVRLVNRTPTANSFLFFANIAVSANRDYQVLFPPDTHWVTNHGKREFAGWPRSDSIYNGIDFRPGVDVSWWKNHHSPISMFAWGTHGDFVGGYDHGRQAGMVHLADHHISPGKKFFTWGCGEAGQMWDRVLTDADGPYIELMAGSYSDNQPDYSWIAPYQSKVAQTFWYPIAQIGGLKNANREAAVNLDVTAGNTAKIGVAVTAEQPELTVRLSAGDRVLFERQTAAGPGRPLVAECPLPAGAGQLALQVFAGQRELIAYTPVARAAGPTPEPLRPPPPPAAIASVEELYKAGLRLEQLRSAALDPADYYREILRREPTHARANTALGIRAWQDYRLTEAEQFLSVAVGPPPQSYLAPKDGEAYYYLGLVRRAGHKLAEADEAFQRAAWVAGWESPANYQLAEMRCGRDDFAQANVHLDRALAANASHVKALTLKAAVLRRLKRSAEAAELLARAAAIDPLDAWPAWENSLATTQPATARRDAPEAVLEPATDYASAGLWEEAFGVLQAATGPAASDALVNYCRAFYLEQLNRAAEAQKYYAAAAQASTDYVFPFRREHFAVFQQARQRNPRDARAAWYLGNLYMLHRQVDAAIAQWEACRELEPAFALVHRNLALAYARRGGDQARGIAALQQALELAPNQPRWRLELDQLYEAGGVPLAQRLAQFDKFHDVVKQRDDALAREIAVRVEAGQLERALALLGGHQFHIWEGAGRTAVHNSYAEAHLLLGQRAGDAGRFDAAIKHFQAALEYPVNLGTGRPVWGERLAETYYRLGTAQLAAKQRDAAAQAFAQAVATAPPDLLAHNSRVADEPEMLYFAGLALEKLNRGAEARAVFENLIESGRDRLADHVPMYFFASFGHPQPLPAWHAQGHYTIGLACLGLGKKAEARQAFAEALALDQRHTSARKQLQSLK